MVMLRYLLSVITISLVFSLWNFGYTQQKKTNWLQDKKEYTGRWRVGVGADIAQPTGLDVQFYRLSRICTSDFSITKKMAVGVWAGKEGFLFGNLIDDQNKVGWEKGSLRFGVDLKFYIPIILNPYIGVGIEGGNRKLNSNNEFSTDLVARVGIEQKVLGIKFSTKSSLNITLFVDGKLNKCLNADFLYIVPGGGVRFHWL